ncbi:MAG: hypothetical protein R2912_06825 [Eubacteriales bacterium]
MSLTGIEGSSLIVQLLKPTSFTPILAVIGIALIMFSKNRGAKPSARCSAGSRC